mmetsp:Transcript_56231/g.168356  ORF Transcript_56231/g.168356 Transcript_56231/m.168356 type:complete len:252 (-) Transcript_56231:1024-1779(-)
MVRLSLAVGGEANSCEHLTNLLLVNVEGLDLLVNEDVIDAGKMRLLALNVSLDEDCTDGLRIRESLHLVVRDGSHQSGLTRIVATEKTIIFTTLQLHLCVVEQNLGTVREGELAVAQLLRIVVFVFLLGNFKHLFALHSDSLSDLLSFVSVQETLELAGNELFPLELVHEMKVHHGGANDRAVLDHALHSLGRLGSDSLCKLGRHLAGIAANGDGLVSQPLEALKLTNGVFGHLTGLGISDTGGIRLKSRE